MRTLGEPTRLRILNIILRDEACVCDLEEILGTSQSNVSRHLAKLREGQILSTRKQAQWVYYDISPSFREEHKDLLAYLETQLQSCPQCQEDIDNLEKFSQTKLC